jgi:hypothetical protein
MDGETFSVYDVQDRLDAAINCLDTLPAAPDTLKDDIGLCAAAVVMAWHRKTHEHILRDDETINAAWRIEKWLGYRK